MIVDPGVQVCGVLFVAIPPNSDEDGKYEEYQHQVHVYDELYIRRCSAQKFAEEVSRKLGDSRRGGLTGFVIDNQMGRQSELGSGRTVETAYSDALKEKGVYSAMTGFGFIYASADVRAREESLRRWMYPNPITGKPTLRIHRSRCPVIEWELEQQFYVKKNGIVTDKRRNKNDHLVFCLEAIADLDPGWEAMRTYDPVASPVLMALSKKLEKSTSQDVISLGPLNSG
jgi:hypothetical protein